MGVKAAVQVSIVGFDGGEEKRRVLDGVKVDKINIDLTSGVDLSLARRLVENMSISFQAVSKYGPFGIEKSVAQKMLNSCNSQNNCPNSDVIKPWANGLDITRRPRNMWIIDFGIDMPIEKAALYKMPFEYVCQHVKPGRAGFSEKKARENWWLFQRPRPAMRIAIAQLLRYIATPRVSKYQLFVYLNTDIIPDTAVVAIARDDDYFLGVLHSELHELWALKLGTSLANTPRYTNTTTFQTFPFPYPPNNEPLNNPHIKAISQIAHTLVRERDIWLNPPNLPEKELKKRTLTNLYNQRPEWLDRIHKRLDNAVLDAYGWPYNLSDNEILERLLKLNLKRSL